MMAADLSNREIALASNPHNTQPWYFRVSDSSIELLADTARHLGSFDAYRREMFLGLGCALENMVLAAHACGYAPAVHLTQGSLLEEAPRSTEPFLAARIEFRPAPASRDALYDAIPHRHTNRGPYDVDQAITADQVERLRTTDGTDSDIKVVLVRRPAARARLGSLIVDATRAIVGDEAMVRDSERWYRHAPSEVRKHRDGPTLDAAGLSPLRTAFAKLLPRPSAAANHGYWLASTREVHVPTAQLFGLILVRDLYDIAQTIRAGRLWHAITGDSRGWR